MSKTQSTCLCETNLLQNKPQENVFFHNLYRAKGDFPNEFFRAAKSTAPIQVCAIFSAIGPDNLSATLNIRLNEELGKIIASIQNQSVLDYESFTRQVINVLNNVSCQYMIEKSTQIKVSMCLIVIEGDTLRVLNVGCNKAVLIRDNKVISLTEPQTVAHKMVQMGSIPAEQEFSHPDSLNLTQYLGKLPQEGEIIPDTKVQLKLKDNDEICLMGLGLAMDMPAGLRNSILVKPTQTETKARELINSAFNYNIKHGLSVVLVKIESTLILPGDAVVAGNSGSIRRNESKTFGEQVGETRPFSANNYNDSFDSEPSLKSKKNTKLKNVLIPICLFLGFAIAGFGLTFLVFNITDMVNFGEETTLGTEETSSLGKIIYVVNDGTPMYATEDESSTQIATLMRGNPVILHSTGNAFSYISTSNGIDGYIRNDNLSENDPTINETLPVIESEITPTPTMESDNESTIFTTGATTSTHTTQHTTTAATEPQNTTIDGEAIEPPPSETTTEPVPDSPTEATTADPTIEATTLAPETNAPEAPADTNE